MPKLRRASASLIVGAHEGLEPVTTCCDRGPVRDSIGRKAAAAILLCASVSAIVLAQAPQPLSLVSTAWTPFTNEPGQPRFALDLVEAALGRTMRTAKTAIVPPAQFTTALLSGKFDGSAAAWKDAERERVLLYSQPYLENRLVLVGRLGADVSAKTLADLKSRRVAIVEGYSYGAIESAGPVFVRASGEEDSLTRVLRGEADYVLMDDLVVTYLIKNYPEESRTRIEVGKTPIISRSLHLALRRSRPDADGLIRRFNAQLKTMIADRSYHKLLRVDWIRADIDGDGVPEDVPLSDKAGTAEPQHIYTLKMPDAKLKVTTIPVTPRFYIGGTIYTDWASVPNRYKVEETNWPPSSARNTGSIFKFVW